MRDVRCSGEWKLVRIFCPLKLFSTIFSQSHFLWFYFIWHSRWPFHCKTANVSNCNIKLSLQALKVKLCSLVLQSKICPMNIKFSNFKFKNSDLWLKTNDYRKKSSLKAAEPCNNVKMLTSFTKTSPVLSAWFSSATWTWTPCSRERARVHGLKRGIYVRLACVNTRILT